MSQDPAKRKNWQRRCSDGLVKIDKATRRALVIPVRKSDASKIRVDRDL
jgi:hypothetical protein